MAEFDFRAYCRTFASDKTLLYHGYLTPFPAAYLALAIGGDGFDALAKGLGLSPEKLCDQLDTHSLNEEHWPTVQQAARAGRERAEQKMAELMKDSEPRGLDS